MKFTHFPAHTFTTRAWQGGTTKELFIFPEGSTYAGRDFEFRLSTATLETEHSTFTSLPGVSRILMILEGKITVHHEGRYSKELQPFDTDTFNGEWNTTSKGTCVDFNLMMKGNVKGELVPLILKAGEKASHRTKEIPSSTFGYVHRGSIRVQVKDTVLELYAGDLCRIETKASETLECSSVTGCDIVLAELTGEL